jgi:hypothetical protein
MNFIIIFIFLAGCLGVFKKSYKLIFKSNEINELRLEIPLVQPLYGITILLKKEILENDPVIYKNVQKNIAIHNLIDTICFVTLLILILIQLKKLLIAINNKTFFNLKNILIIRYLSVLVAIWVICNFLIYQLIPFFIPLELISEGNNFIPINISLVGNLLGAIDYKMLFVAIILYVISISFKEGYQLKEQSDLTI